MGGQFEPFRQQVAEHELDLVRGRSFRRLRFHVVLRRVRGIRRELVHFQSVCLERHR